MPTILKTLLLLWHLWHFEVYAVELLEPTAPTSAYVNDSGVDFEDLRQAENAAATVEALIPPSTLLPKSIPDETTPTARQRRQLFYDPSLVLVTSFGSEGGKCITSRGTAGVCVRLSGCQSYYRYKRQLAYFALQQWAQSVSPVEQEICSFYDQFGRASSGICCTQTSTQDSGLGLLPAFLIPAAVNPIPPPPTTATPTVETDNATDNADNGEHDLDNATEVVSAATIMPDSLQTSSPEFQDENNVIYDTVRDDADEKLQPQQPTAVSTYDDFLYQWPTQFASHFGTGIHQWPPPLPTHPPSAANWPPPIPTHPPNHHYPTHPAAAVKPTSAPTTTITTRRPTTTTSTTRRTFTTTTRRPSYPSYPGYPGFPSYPSYPTYRPPTHATTTTRRPPAASQPDSSTPNGLPLQCGVKNRVSPDQERIVGGSNASPHEFPWIAVLFKAGKQFCGGSLITQNHILTAAHCVARMTSWDVAALTAHLGDYNIRTDFEVKHVVRRIKRLVRHKGFDFSTLHNDIAILTVNEPVKFSYEIQPICLPTSSAQQGRSYSGQLATVAGWGSLRENGPQPSILQKVQIPIWTNDECARKYGRAAPGGIIDSMICAGQVSKDSCSGDSGGPMIVSEDGRYTQVGIVSWGIGCGKGEYPGVYTRVTSLLSWIFKNIK